jgi:hypothetical protein
LPNYLLRLEKNFGKREKDIGWINTYGEYKKSERGDGKRYKLYPQNS